MCIGICVIDRSRISARSLAPALSRLPRPAPASCPCSPARAPPPSANLQSLATRLGGCVPCIRWVYNPIQIHTHTRLKYHTRQRSAERQRTHRLLHTALSPSLSPSTASHNLSRQPPPYIHPPARPLLGQTHTSFNPPRTHSTYLRPRSSATSPPRSTRILAASSWHVWPSTTTSQPSLRDFFSPHFPPTSILPSLCTASCTLTTHHHVQHGASGKSPLAG